MVGNNSSMTAVAPARRILNIGVTGHREGNRHYDANSVAIEAAFASLLNDVCAHLQDDTEQDRLAVRIVTNLAHGSDLMAARVAVARGLEVIAPLPFGSDLNLAINTPGADWKTSLRLAQGNWARDGDEDQHVERYRNVLQAARCFALCDKDEELRSVLETLASDADSLSARREFDILVTERTKVASRITIEQSDIVVAIWDGIAASSPGGTRDTMAKALAVEVPVIWIDARKPTHWHWLDDLGDLAVAREREADVTQQAIVSKVADVARSSWQALDTAAERLERDRWHPKSARRFHAYRRIERSFAGGSNRLGSVRQRYEEPGDIAEGSAAALLRALADLPGSDTDQLAGIRERILPRFALADGISAYLSDAYRGGMVASFLLSAAAIIGGVAYLPLVGPELKWPFAALEFVLLLAIVAITIAGVRGDWHRRWFRTRRVAEYLRHAPIMLAIGCMRPKGHWPTSRDEQWPEIYARHITMDVGLPNTEITAKYLHKHLQTVLRPFLVAQRDYHRQKAARLERVHHNLDRVSEILFVLAIVSVGAYLALKLAGGLGAIAHEIPLGISKLTTFFGVAFPTLGAAIAGIRYFGDFERFAAISDVTSEKLDRLLRRADLLLEGRLEEIGYPDFVDLAHAMNDVMIEEIESWQSIFGTKKMSVPV